MIKRLELVVFFSGAVGMILELVGSRVLSPFFGNSLFVWTGLIGVILGSMSLGYHFGGKLADKGGGMVTMGKILLAAAGFVLVTAFSKEQVLTIVASVFSYDVRAASLIGILLLFAPASLLLGCISPYAASVRLTSDKKVGSTIGSLYALSTLGSISGTFLAGYFLIPTFGNTSLLYILSLVLVVLSLLCVKRITKQLVTLTLFGIFIYHLNINLGLFKLNVLEDIDSLYNRILVRQIVYKDKPAISLTIENLGSQSTVFPGSPEVLVSDYTNAYRIGGLIKPSINKALVLGGAGFTFPRFFLENSLGNSIDVVEIDERMIDMARKYFFLKDDPRMKIVVADARMFIKETKEKYDVIYFDAFSSINPPYHLTTKEFMSQLRDHLNDNGILMVNMISSTRGSNSQFLNIEGRTLKEVFGQVDLFVIQQKSSDEVQNLMVVAYKGERPKEIKTNDELLKKLTRERYRLEERVTGNLVLTDDFAPVDYITRGLYRSLN